ncbi:uncharacterized protein LOC134215035 [Armigeres subalbatus]|uniref:uncharacterized protein LOC134215035 n=1 Tax=Armigeres subalbatus TaxID=124917 RepID=UPI002ED3FB4F
MAETYLPILTEAFWKNCSEGSYDRMDFPNCCVAVDGKHIAIQCPPNAGSLFYNYKKQHSIVLMAICDAQYNFLAVDIGAYGGNSDGSVFASSEFGKLLLSGTLGLPPPSKLPHSTIECPHFIVGDAAFPLKPSLMRPFPGKNLTEVQRNFNKRQSAARRPIENTFGIMVARWRILKSPLCMFPESAEKLVKAIVVLHNFVKIHNEHQYAPPEFVDRFDESGNLIPGEWRTQAQPLPSVTSDVVTRGHNAPRNAYHVRNDLAQYVIEHPAKRKYNV